MIPHSRVKCLPSSHQVFSCLCSKVTVYRRKWQWFSWTLSSPVPVTMAIIELVPSYNKDNIVFKEGIGVVGLRFKLHGNKHGKHYGNHHGYHHGHHYGSHHSNHHGNYHGNHYGNHDHRISMIITVMIIMIILITVMIAIIIVIMVIIG